MSPYPTVVTVCSAHHMPSQMFENSVWSSARINAPEAMTTTAVTMTITLAAARMVGGSVRNSDHRFLSGLRETTAQDGAPPAGGFAAGVGSTAGSGNSRIV